MSQQGIQQRLFDHRGAALQHQLDEALPGAVAGFGWLFDAMELAEEEIAAAMRGGTAEQAARIHGAFGELQPPPALCDLRNRELYRHHVRELLGRAAVGADLTPGTEAEVLVVLMHTSLKAPLTRGGLSLYARTMRSVFGDDCSAAAGVEIHEDWPGELDELLNDARRLTGRARSTR